MSIEGRPGRSRSIATIHAALDAGITLIDTADAYHVGSDEVGHNETLIAEALGPYGGDTADVLVATKGGHLRPGDGSWTVDSSPEHLRAARSRRSPMLTGSAPSKSPWRGCWRLRLWSSRFRDHHARRPSWTRPGLSSSTSAPMSWSASARSPERSGCGTTATVRRPFQPRGVRSCPVADLTERPDRCRRARRP